MFEPLTCYSIFLIELLQDDQEPKDPKFSPDGGYIPRILFMGKSVCGVLQVRRDSKSDNLGIIFCISS